MTNFNRETSESREYLLSRTKEMLADKDLTQDQRTVLKETQRILHGMNELEQGNE